MNNTDFREMRTGITFILPTLNRRPWVKRALDSCLACENDFIKPHVVVIDSQSDDGTLAYLREIYGEDDRVTLCQNSRWEGCGESWLQGVPLVKTELATFMFDDDVLSPFFKDMAAYVSQTRGDFIMGSGAVCDVNALYDFRPIEGFNSYARSDLLLGYFGFGDHVRLPSLPLSPICCVVTSELLREWADQVRKFAGRSAFRRYFMLKRCIGPDLMIYMAALLKSQGPAFVTPSVVTQFSVHSGSITIGAKAFDLAAGYWLARVWAFERIAMAGGRDETAWYAACVLLFAVRLITLKLLRLESSWVMAIIGEMWNVFTIVARKRSTFATFVATFVVTIRKIKQRMKGRGISAITA